MARRQKKRRKRVDALPSTPATGCSRCGAPVDFMEAVCGPCFEKDPKLTTEEKTRINRWDDIDDVIEVIKLSRE